MNEDRPEYILCAANWYDDGREYPHPPRNIKTGIVVCGRRHHNAMYTAAALVGRRWPSLREIEQDGFMTSRDRWVDRKEAFQIAKAAGQINWEEVARTGRRDREGTDLYSEDLY